MTVGEFFDEYNLLIKDITDEDIEVEDYDLRIPVSDVRDDKSVESFYIDHERKQVILK